MRKILALILLLMIPTAIRADFYDYFELPREGLSDNAVVDIVKHRDGIWIITGNGVSYTRDAGVNWFYYDSTNGLFTSDMAAIYSGGDRIWLGMAPGSGFESGNYLSFSDNDYDDIDGFIWDTIQVDTSYFYDCPIFDITGGGSLIFFSSKVGGLFGSFDDGTTWRNLFYSRGDSVSKNDVDRYTNHYFSTVLDTLHQDTFSVWGGTADGLMRFMYVPKSSRPSSNYITSIYSDSDYVYICGDSGLSRLDFADSTEHWFSSFEENGLPGKAVTAVFTYNDRVFAGTLDTLGGDGTGLSVSDDGGLLFTSNFPELAGMLGENRYPVDFAAVDTFLFMAAFESGLFKSSDGGDSWVPVDLDPSPGSGRDIVHSLDVDSNVLWVGTDSGVVRLTLDLDDGASIASAENTVFNEDDDSGARAKKVRIQRYRDSEGNVDSTVVWTILHPLDTLVGTYAVYYSRDDGASWLSNSDFLIGAKHFDIGFSNNVIFLGGYDAVRDSPDRVSWRTTPGAFVYDSAFAVLNTFNDLKINAVHVARDTLYLGSEYGLAISPPGTAIRWHMVIADLEPTHFQRSDRFTVDHGLPGNFAIALDIQDLPGSDDLLWVSARAGATGGGADGIAVSSIHDNEWEVKYTGTRCLNMAFNGTQVYAATDAGLLFSADGGDSWDTLTIIGTLINFPEPIPDTIQPGTAVYSLLVDNDTLWVGTEDGLASIHIDSIGTETWDINRVYDPSQQVYAYPTPFSPYDLGGRVTFHYPVPQDAYATVEVYDFAMNLVRRVVGGEWKNGGVYDTTYISDIYTPEECADNGLCEMAILYETSSTDRWDGRNGNGDIVAAGIYYFKVTLSTGETYWGKLAVKP